MVAMAEPLFWCVRQRAGPLVKECRALRPRMSAMDDQQERAEKNQLRHPRFSVLSRRPADRLELRLALFGFDGVFYTLTYGDYLPETFADVRRDLRNFFGRVRRWKKGNPFDWAYCIEGKHGDHRWHVHLVLRASDFSPAEIAFLWRHGFVDDKPLLRETGGFWRIASYLNKERRGGILPVGGHPWSCSRSLLRQLPPPERWRDTSGEISMPEEIFWRGPCENLMNEFGVYRFASWIEKPP